MKLATREQIRVSNWINNFSIEIDGKKNSISRNIIALGSYNMLIGMYKIEGHKALVNCLEKIVTCVTHDRKNQIIKGIYRPASLPQISTLHLKKEAKKGCQLFVIKLEYYTKNKIVNLDVVKEF